jgi:MFS family permease
MRIEPVEQPVQRRTALAELGEGLRYVLANKVILSLTIGVGLVSLFGIGMLNLLPAWAKDILKGDVTTNGWLVSARGFGSLISALMLAYWGSRKLRGKMWTIGAFVMPVLLFIFAWVRWLPLSLLMLVGVGWGFMLVINNSQAIIQSLVSDRLRGRVMGVYTLIFFGAMPLGSLLSGSLAEQIGEPVTVMVGAVALFLLAVAAWFFLPEIRRQD